MTVTLHLIVQLLVLKAVVLRISAQEYSFSENNAIQNLIYDESSKRVFVGGTNKIFRLSVSINTVVKHQ